MHLLHLPPLFQGLPSSSLPVKRNFVFEVEYHPQFVLLCIPFRKYQESNPRGPVSRYLSIPDRMPRVGNRIFWRFPIKLRAEQTPLESLLLSDGVKSKRRILCGLIWL